MLSSQIGEAAFWRGLVRFSKGRFVFSWLIGLFIMFGFSGCGETYKFYNEELDFISSTSNTNIAFTEKVWYEANSAEPYNGVYNGNGKAVKLYAVPNVKEIRTQEDLENIVLDLNGKYILLNDITLEGEWTPIGTEDEPFSGILNSDTSDGKRYAIKSLKITLPNIDTAGFFGHIKDAIIKNIGIVLEKIQGEINVGGITGKAVFSNITNSYVVGNISGSGYVGGLVGHADLHNNISNSYTSVNINAIKDVGGIVGYIGDSIITNSYTTGNINGYTNVGGIAGSFNSSVIASTYTAANVSGGIKDIGGVVGALFSGNISATIVIIPSDINDNIKKITGGLVIGYVVDTTSAIIFSNSVTYTIDYILSILGFDISDKIETYLSKVLTNVYGKLWDFVISKPIVSRFDERYTYSVGLNWKWGKDDANPWVTPKDGGAPILYWQVDE
ncbi:MAG: hypothetical protein LBF13_03240 [Campylobacteraceae bacterium]|nr:hypothetical protein [Campylobacteraceae bacterium]